MIEENDLSELKEKFGSFLSYCLYDGKIRDEVIDEKVYDHPFFDFLENNDTQSLLGQGNAELFHLIFGAYPTFFSQGESDSRANWAGRAYLDLAIRSQTPLKQVFLQLPLGEMIRRFDPYHEMDEDSLLSSYLANEKQKPILPLLLEKETISTNQLSFITGINRQNLIAYAKSNERLFSAHHSRIAILNETLGVSPSYFKETSSFVYFDPFFLKSPEFLGFLSQYLIELFGLRNDKERVVMTGDELEDFSEKEMDKDHLVLVFPYAAPTESKIKALQHSFRSFILFGEPLSYYYWQTSTQRIRKILPEKLNDLALIKATRNYLSSHQKITAK
jgi:hypothetical protein